MSFAFTVCLYVPGPSQRKQKSEKIKQNKNEKKNVQFTSRHAETSQTEAEGVFLCPS